MPAELVWWLGAVQAQDFLAAKWAVGLRLSDAEATDARVERAVSDGEIVRTHALRGTWQFVSPEDVRWLVTLVAPRVLARAAKRHRDLGLDARTFRRSAAALEKALRGGRELTREELGAALTRARIAPDGQRLPHLLAHAELAGLLCGGARRGKQFTWALLDERAPAQRHLTRDEALAELAGRYFRSRGPATVNDFAWWSGLSPSDARAALEAVKSTLVSEAAGGQTLWRADDPPGRAPAVRAYLLPAFDEFLVAYRVRDHVLDPWLARRLNANGGMLNPCVVVGGRVVGTWSRALGKKSVRVELSLFEKPSAAQQRAIAGAAERYAAFLGLEAETVEAAAAGA